MATTHALLAMVTLAVATLSNSETSKAPSTDSPRLGDGVSVMDASPNAFGFPLPTLDAAERRAFVVGNSFFKQNWVTAPSSTSARDGLGPLFNARSCSSCHVRDGRSAPPDEHAIDRSGLLIRIGVRSSHGADVPHPVYGEQIQDVAVLGVHAEARVEIRSTVRGGTYGDGAPFELVEPKYALTELAYGPLGDDVVLSARTAPSLVGLGLLEAIPVAAIAARADPDDRNGDGISGRAHFVDGPSGARILGRFGWKAAQPDVRSQTAAAFRNDMGITSPVQPDEPLTDHERSVVTFTSGGSPEIETDTFERVVFYTRVLAVPAQRDVDDPRVVHGRAAFDGFGCAACHVPQYTTGSDSDVVHCRERVIRPYTDLLLHDMGPELADEKHDGDASPSEWRTPPLWGIGLVHVVNGHTRFLHDGRARNLPEAILWHGGEAHVARERFRNAPRDERDALIAFLESL